MLQVGVFSATLPPEALEITRKFMNKPVSPNASAPPQHTWQTWPHSKAAVHTVSSLGNCSEHALVLLLSEHLRCRCAFW